MRKITCIILLSLAFLVLFSGCNKKTSPSSSNGRKSTITIAIAADATTMDPQGSNEVPSIRVREHLFETLVYKDENQDLNPGLALEWEWRDDFSIKMRLRQGVKFHDGSDFTAQDVKFSLERARDSSFVGYKFSSIDHVEIVDNYNVIVHLKSTYALIFEMLSDPAADIVCKSYVERVGPDRFASEPIGTGQYQFSSWRRGDRIEIKRWDNYWGERKAQTENLVFRVLTESATRTIELETGGVDIALDIPPNDVNRINNNPRLQMLMCPSFQLAYIGLNTEKAPFNDKRVRQAINYALDMEGIVSAVYSDIGSPLAGAVTSMCWGVDPSIKPYPYNPDRARQLFAEAGYPNGFRASIWCNENQQRMDMAEIVQNQLRPYGITLDFSVVEWGTYLEKTINGEHDMAIFGWSGGLVDATLFGNFHSRSRGPAGNISFLSNLEFDRQLDSSRNTKDDNLRRQNYFECQRIVYEECPWVFVWEGAILNAAKAEVKGYILDPNTIIRLWNVYIEE
jgi:peptide/nickel transport system substrate-binding protein